IDRPTSGEVAVDGISIERSSERTLAAGRGGTVGVVFQFFQLLPTLTVLENVVLPMDFLRARPAKTRRPYALALLDRVGLADQAARPPGAGVCGPVGGGESARHAAGNAFRRSAAGGGDRPGAGERSEDRHRR